MLETLRFGALRIYSNTSSVIQRLFVELSKGYALMKLVKTCRAVLTKLVNGCSWLWWTSLNAADLPWWNWVWAVSMQSYRYFVNHSSEFCRHNPLCCFWTSVYCCWFRYRLSSETFGYTLVCPFLSPV